MNFIHKILILNSSMQCYHLFCILTGCHCHYGQFRDCSNTRNCPKTKSILLEHSSTNHRNHKKILIVMPQLGTHPHPQEIFSLHRSNLSPEMLLARILYLANDEKENNIIRTKILFIPGHNKNNYVAISIIHLFTYRSNFLKSYFPWSCHYHHIRVLEHVSFGPYLSTIKGKALSLSSS